MTRLLISTAVAGLLALAGPALAQGPDDHRDDHNRPQRAEAPAQPAPQQAARPDNGGRNGRDFRPGPAAQNTPAPAPQNNPRDNQRGNFQRGDFQRGQAANNAAPPQNDQRGNFQRGDFQRGQAANNTPPPQNDQRGNFQRGDFQRGQANNAPAPAQLDRRAQQDRRPSAGAQNAPTAEPAPRAAMRDQGPNNAMRGPSNAMRGPNNSVRRDFASFHRNFSAPRRFHAAVYDRPRGWYSHRWTFGETLPSLFWTENYWLNDYMDFGLEPPPPGTVWVRDGDDALLIDRYSGEIIQVEYSVFF